MCQALKRECWSLENLSFRTSPDPNRGDLGGRGGSGIDPTSIRHRSCIDLGSIWHRSRIDLGSIRGLSGSIRKTSWTIKDIQKLQRSSKRKNHQLQFLRLRFEALDEPDRLVTLPKVENKETRSKNDDFLEARCPHYPDFLGGVPLNPIFITKCLMARGGSHTTSVNACPCMVARYR